MCVSFSAVLLLALDRVFDVLYLSHLYQGTRVNET